MTTRIYLFLSFLLVTSTLIAQWQQTEGPEGGSTYAIERINGVLWAGTQGGLYQSWDEGLTWYRNESFEEEWSVTSIEIIDGEIFLAVAQANDGFYDFDLFLYRSTDGGLSWNVSQVNIFNGFVILDSVELFKMEDRLFFWFEHNLYRSDDDGQTWINLWSNFPSFITELGYDDTHMVATNATQIFISTDFGETWALLADVGTQADVLLEDDFLMIPNYDTMMISNDLGQTWSQHPLPTPYFYGELRRGNSGKLYALDRRLYVSENNGISWDTLNSTSFGNVYDFIEEDDGEYIMSSYTGIFTSSNQGENWFSSYEGIKASSIYDLYVAPSGEVFARTNLGNLRSPNGGIHWFPWEQPANYATSPQIIWSGDTAIIAAGNAVYRSTDQMLTYENITPPSVMSGADYLSMDGNKIHLVLGNENTIYVTSNHGATWESMTGPVNNQSPDYTHLEIVNGVFLLVDGSGEIYRSTNNGNTWSLVLEFSASGVTYHQLHQIGNRVLLADNNGWFYSTDEGLNWTEFTPTGIPILESFHDAPEPLDLLPIGNLLFAIHRFHGVYVSSDFGSTWETTNVGLGNLRSRSIATGAGIMYLGTTQGSVWKRGANFQETSGEIFEDLNGNGIKDTEDTPMTNIIVEASPLQSYASSNLDGNYTLYAEAFNDTIRAIPPSPYSTVTPPFYVANETSMSNDFGIYFTPDIDDLCLIATVLEPIRPGFESSLTLTVKNVGTTHLSPEVKLLLPEGIEMINATPIPNAVNNDTLIWQLDELPFFDCQNITLRVIASTDLTLGEEVSFVGLVLPDSQDQNIENNALELVEMVVGSFDPNDKKVTPSFLKPEELAMGERLTYTIRFQNTGTYYAENVRIVDTLSTDLDISSLEIIAASHEPMDWHIRNGRVLEFVFENILLPDASSDEAASHGFVKFGIRPETHLTLGDKIANTGYIYFDFNEAIVTNTAIAPISTVSSVVDIQIANTLMISPNPNQRKFRVDISKIQNGMGHLEIFHIDGRQVYSKTVWVERGGIVEQKFNEAAGQYLVRLTVNGERFLGKMIVLE